jgi:hypothetical protein
MERGLEKVAVRRSKDSFAVSTIGFTIIVDSNNDLDQVMTAYTVGVTGGYCYIISQYISQRSVGMGRRLGFCS